MKINFKDNEFWFKTLFYTGMQGYMFLGIVQGVPSLFETMFHPLFIYICLSIMCLFSMFYIILLTLKQRQITKNEIINCLTLIPIMSWSYLGQLGNSEAISTIFGNTTGILFNVLLLPIYIFITYKITKSIKK